MKIGDLWNSLANPKNVPRLFAIILGACLIAGFLIPMELNPDQLYPRPAPQSQVDEGLSLAPYERGGEILKTPGEIKSQYPATTPYLGMITSYISPIPNLISDLSPYFGTLVYSSPGGLIDEVLYYTRGFDTILESSILMMSFVIASWLAINFTMNRKNETKNIKKGFKKAIDESNTVASEIESNKWKNTLNKGDD
ncbi:EhaF family protein [Methanobrevibacter sp. DSM 116169]|uniref:EhaF family protein n=1 Tax=Methanobrevibacter sp. DSM 116169 TaxID=3242727 RepID=UPI0038FD2914